MTREKKVSTLIQYLKQENQGYASIPDPIDEGEQRRLLRSLMNVRYPGHASAEYEKLQDELLQEEAEEKGIVTCNDIPVIEQEYPCSEIKNSDRISMWRRRCNSKCSEQSASRLFCTMSWLHRQRHSLGGRNSAS